MAPIWGIIWKKSATLLSQHLVTLDLQSERCRGTKTLSPFRAFYYKTCFIAFVNFCPSFFEWKVGGFFKKKMGQHQAGVYFRSSRPLFIYFRIFNTIDSK